MGIFEYKGISKEGKDIRGTLDADNPRMARLKLKKDGIFITDLKDKQKKAQVDKSKGRRTGGRVNIQDLSVMTRQLATLIKSTIPLVECLTAVADQVENPTLKEALFDIRDMVNEGSSLHRALNKYPRIFDKIYVSMCEAGEMSGTLDQILLRLAEFKESQNEMVAKIRWAIFYPIIMVFFTLGVLMFLFTYVIPQVKDIFEQADMKLPWYSEIVIGASGFVVNYWFVLIIFPGVMATLFLSWKATPKGSFQWDRIKLKLPLIGKITRMIAVSRFTRTLSTLLSGGVPMLMSMDIVKNVVNNQILSEAIEVARDNISEGENIAVPLRKSGQFPPIVIHMISIGEKTGDLERMLTQVSESYEFQVKTSVQTLTSLLEPIMIIMMGGVIGVIVVAIMVPIFQMANIAQ